MTEQQHPREAGQKASAAERAQSGDLVAQEAGQAPAQQPRGQTLAELIELQKPAMARALPKHVDADRMARMALTLLRKQPDLGKCSSGSFLGALMTCAQLGLEPGPLGEAWIIPFGREATFVPGYKGLIKLAWQSEQLAGIAAHVVYSHDEFEFEFGLTPHLKHRPTLDKDRGYPIAVYATAHFRNGGNAFEVMSVEQVEMIKRRSRGASRSDSPWKTDWDQMAKKTVIKQLAKWLPMSAELRDLHTALDVDGGVRNTFTTKLDEAEVEHPEVLEGDIEPEPSQA